MPLGFVAMIWPILSASLVRLSLTLFSARICADCIPVTLLNTGGNGCPSSAFQVLENGPQVEVKKIIRLGLRRVEVFGRRAGAVNLGDDAAWLRGPALRGLSEIA